VGKNILSDLWVSLITEFVKKNSVICETICNNQEYFNELS
jgi:hypothetical protein